MKNYVYALIGVSFLAFQINAGAQELLCGDLENAFGPYDYTHPGNKRNLNIVNRVHFTSNVERLVSAKGGTLGGNIDYTLRAFPNHHRALDAMARLAIKQHTSKPVGAQYTLECYFDRARRFRPDDAMVPLIYGMYFYRTGKLDHALEKLKEAERLQPDNPNINYNLGLLYFTKEDYENARTHAKKAYARGFELPGLKQKLVAAGQWREN
jgi:tetratricopeptide (TPR) repeat protein